MDGLSSEEVAHSNTLKEAANMSREPRKTWRYFAQAVIQEEDSEKLTYLMQHLNRVLIDNDEQPFRNI